MSIEFSDHVIDYQPAQAADNASGDLSFLIIYGGLNDIQRQILKRAWEVCDQIVRNSYENQ